MTRRRCSGRCRMMQQRSLGAARTKRTKRHDETARRSPQAPTDYRFRGRLTPIPHLPNRRQKLGRPKNHARLVAQVCDLLDAAAAFADVPLLALITVLEADHRIQCRAWTADDVN